MKRISAILSAFFFLCCAANAQTICNDPSGFLKSFGPIAVGNLLTLGPDCQHAQDGGTPNATALIPTQSVVTFTLTAPGVMNWPAHNLALGATLIFSTTGTLPTPLAIIPLNSNPTPVYAIPIDANNLRLATTLTNAVNGIAITLTGPQAGTHTAFANAVACAGCIGETIWNTVPLPGIALTGTAVDRLWNTIVVTPGIWQFEAQSGVFGGSVAVTTMFATYGLGITTVGSSPDFGRLTGLNVNSNNTNDWIFPNMATVGFITAQTGNQNLNAVLNASYAGTNPSAYGTLKATRIR